MPFEQMIHQRFRTLRIKYRRESMNRKTCFQIGALALVFTSAGSLIWPAPAYSETAGMERRDDRRDDRQGAQDTRQEGREVARDIKEQCRGAGGSGPECRQAKRKTKQKARQSARDIKIND